MAFVAKGLRRELPGGEGEPNRVLFHSLDVEVPAGGRLFITGRSGSGKSLLLRVIAELDEAQEGRMTLGGQTAEEMGLPQWRCEVCYVTQARWSLPGTPSDSFQELCKLAAQQGRAHGDPVAYARKLLLDDRNVRWMPQIQAMLKEKHTFFITVGAGHLTGPKGIPALLRKALLLDEVTSACDPVSTLAVEATLLETGCTLMWVSHDPAQPVRVGGNTLRFPPNEPHTEEEEGPPV